MKQERDVLFERSEKRKEMIIMPNQQNVNMSITCKRFDEAIRAIAKYQFNAEKEPNALLDPAMDVLNGIYYTNPCMHHKRGEKNITKGLKQFYKDKTNKEPPSDATACTCIVTMPKDFMKANYKIKDENGNLSEMTDHQFILLDKYFKEKENNNLACFNTNELKEIETLKESVVHPQWSEDELNQIHQFMKATTYLYCKMAGIKGPKISFKKNDDGDEKTIESMDFEGSDVLWSVSHLSESWPHLHLGFLPLAYIEDKTLSEKYKEVLETRKAIVQELIDSGMNKKEASTMVPKIIRPYGLDGDLGREIQWDEKATCSTARRFRIGYLQNINKTLENGLLKEFNITAKIATGVGKQFDVQKTKRDVRFQESTDQKLLMELLAEKKRLQEKNQKMQSKFDITYASMREEIKAANNELTRVIYEKETAEAETLASKAETVKAEERVAQAEERVIEMEYKIEDLKDEFEGEKIEYEEKISKMQQALTNLKTELKNTLDKAAHFVSTFFENYSQKWEKAKMDSEKRRVDEEFKIKAKVDMNKTMEPLIKFGKAAEILLEEEIINGVNMSTFNQTDQKVGFAKKQIQKMANQTGKAEIFENSNMMDWALQDWFDKEKHKKAIMNMSEENASIYKLNPNRAARAVDYALEKAYELDENFDRE